MIQKAILPLISLLFIYLANCMPQIDKESDINSGKWLPTGDKGECGTRLSVSDIVGGRKTKFGDYPYMVLIGYDNDDDGTIDGYRCGGSLINKWYILTAAHCINTPNGFPAEIILGEHDVGKDPDCDNCPKKISRKIGIENCIVHEDFIDSPAVTAETYRNDIALIRLDEPVLLYSEDPKSSVLIPVCLPWSKDNPSRFLEDGNTVIVTGWGKTSNNQVVSLRVFSDVLKQVKLPIANNLCTEGNFKIDGTQICAGGDKGRDSCNADSGGPMVYREFSDEPLNQVGIVSFGDRCGKEGSAGVYTKVSEFIPWIKSKMEE